MVLCLYSAVFMLLLLLSFLHFLYLLFLFLLSFPIVFLFFLKMLLLSPSGMFSPKYLPVRQVYSQKVDNGKRELLDLTIENIILNSSLASVPLTFLPKCTSWIRLIFEKLNKKNLAKPRYL